MELNPRGKQLDPEVPQKKREIKFTDKKEVKDRKKNRNRSRSKSEKREELLGEDVTASITKRKTEKENITFCHGVSFKAIDKGGCQFKCSF